MARRKSHLAPIAVALACVATLVVAAQDALDASLSSLGRINQPRTSQADRISAPIYSVNRGSGEFEYNRAAAFNDPTYDIYQRYRRGPIDAPYQGGGRQALSPRVRPAPRATPGVSRRNVYGGARPTGARSISRPTYRPAPRAPSGRTSLRAPTYRVNTRVR